MHARSRELVLVLVEDDDERSSFLEGFRPELRDRRERRLPRLVLVVSVLCECDVCVCVVCFEMGCVCVCTSVSVKECSTHSLIPSSSHLTSSACRFDTALLG